MTSATITISGETFELDTRYDPARGTIWYVPGYSRHAATGYAYGPELQPSFRSIEAAQMWAEELTALDAIGREIMAVTK